MPLPLRTIPTNVFYYAHVARSQQCSLKLNEFNSHYSNANILLKKNKTKKLLCLDRIWVENVLYCHESNVISALFHTARHWRQKTHTDEGHRCSYRAQSCTVKQTVLLYRTWHNGNSPSLPLCFSRSASSSILYECWWYQTMILSLERGSKSRLSSHNE